MREKERKKELEIWTTTMTVAAAAAAVVAVAASQPVGQPSREDRGEEGNDIAPRLSAGFDTFTENYATVTAATVVSSAFFESLRNRSIAVPRRGNSRRSRACLRGRADVVRS